MIITRLDQVAKIAGEREYQLSQGKEEAHKLRRAYDELCDQLEASRVESYQSSRSPPGSIASSLREQVRRQPQNPGIQRVGAQELERRARLRNVAVVRNHLKDLHEGP